MSKVHRIFRIDVGRMPPHKAAEHLEKIKDEVSKEKPENYLDYFIATNKENSGIEIFETELCDCNCKHKK